jgi:hypothetical protein
MSGQDAPSHEMPKFARQARLSQEREELALDMLLDGMPLPPEAPPEMSALPLMLAELSGPAGPGELAGETVALSRFRRHPSPAGISSRRKPERRMPSWQSPARRAQLAAALTVAAIGLGGTAAAYAGVLPAPVQDVAHHYLGAPAASPHPGKIIRRAAHRPAPPPAGRALGPHGAPPGQLDHAAGPGNPPKSGQIGRHNPHGAGAHGHGTPPSQRAKPGPLAHPGPPGPQKKPGAGQQGHSSHPGSQAKHPSPPAWGRRSKPYRSGPPGHSTRPGHPASPGHSGGHGHTAHGRQGRAR